MTIKIKRAKKLNLKLDISARYPNKTGPTKNPKKPIPDTKEIPRDASRPLNVPANLNISGITTLSPIPTKPNPIKAIIGCTKSMHTNPRDAIKIPPKIKGFDPNCLLMASPKKRPIAIVAEKTVYPKPNHDNFAKETFSKYKALQSTIAPSVAIIKNEIIPNTINGVTKLKLNVFSSSFTDETLM